MSDKIKHCCQFMTKFVVDPRVEIEYYQFSRGYYIGTQSKAYDFILYCPFCGSKLPKNLHYKWFDIMEKEYGLDDPWGDEQKNKVPDEFNTDEWWKKRNL